MPSPALHRVPQWLPTRCVLTCLIVALLVLLLGVLQVSPCIAQTLVADDSTAGDTPVMGPFYTVTDDEGDYLLPAVAFNSHHDEYLIVWKEEHETSSDISGRRANANGPIGSPFVIASATDVKNSSPEIAYNSVNDEYLVVYNREQSNTDVRSRGRRVAWDGSWISDEISFIRPGTKESDGTQWAPSVAYNESANEYLVVFSNMWSSTFRDVDAQRIRGQDGVLLSWRTIASVPDTQRSNPHVAYNPTRNEYLIAYDYVTESIESADIYARIATANLETLSAELHLTEDVYGQMVTAVSAHDEEYFVVWHERVERAYHRIGGRYVSGGGVLQPTISIYDVHDAMNIEPSTDYSTRYGQVVVWSDVYAHANLSYVWGRTVDPSTQQLGSVFGVDRREDIARMPATACSDDGNCLVAERTGYSGSTIVRYRMLGIAAVYAPRVEN